MTGLTTTSSSSTSATLRLEAKAACGSMERQIVLICAACECPTVKGQKTVCLQMNDTLEKEAGFFSPTFKPTSQGPPILRHAQLWKTLVVSTTCHGNRQKRLDASVRFSALLSKAQPVKIAAIAAASLGAMQFLGPAAPNTIASCPRRAGTMERECCSPSTNLYVFFPTNS